LIVTAMVGIGLGIGGLAGILWIGTQDLPSFESLQEYHPNVVTRVYADNGSVIGQYYVERRIYIPLSEIPQHLVNAVIAVEDARFFDHPGLDIVGIGRAAWTNLKRGGKIQGASTITQQLARSLFLSPERTYTRKIRELILAIKMEFVLTKEQILEMYLNQIYFGHGAYGVGSASLTYFDKELSDISLPQAAFLAGLPKAPSTYSPYRNPQLAKKRQEHVLNRMVQADFIPQALADELANSHVSFKRRSFKTIASYFLEHVRQTLVEQYGETMVYKGGLQVYTTLNPAMQKAAEEAVKIGLRQLDKRQGWRGPIGHINLDESKDSQSEEPTLRDLVQKSPTKGLFHAVVLKVTEDSAEILVADTYKGRIALKDMRWARRRLEKGDEVTDAVVLANPTADQILTSGDIIEVVPKKGDLESGEFRLEQTPIVEGALLALDPRTGAIKAMVGGYDFERSQFNRAVIAHRQSGSAFKPIIYSTALKKGMTPATLILDAPVVYVEEDSEKIWKPENYEKRFYGTITLREALRHSRNAATVRLLEKIGVKDVIHVARSLGIRSHLDDDLSLALGSSSVTLQELTAAYGVFANQGLGLPPYSVTVVKNLDGQVLTQHRYEPHLAIEKETAYLITNMLMDVIQRGTGRKAKIIGRPLAGKTGTTNSFNDAWFVGYAPNLATGVWVGFDAVRTLGKFESGAHAALPIWTNFMTRALKRLPVMAFEIPEGIRFAEVESKTGLLASGNKKKTTTEVFAAGTEPTKPTRQKANPLSFYELDNISPFSMNKPGSRY
jgi:penicillin-binding protein 1A